MNTQGEKLLAVRTGKTIYRKGDTVVKSFDRDYSKADILNEALNQARVEETGLNIPKVLEVAKIDGQWSIITEFIEGKTMQRLMEEQPEQKNAYLERFVALQMEVHSKTCPMLNLLTEKMHRKLDNAPFDATTRYELQTLLRGMPKHNKVCHGDFNPSNIILTPDGLPYLLDWSHVTQGNASADVARSFLLFHLAGELGLAERYLDLFCEKSNTAKQYVQKWIPIVAASQSVKGKPEEREFLRHWVSVVYYE